MGGKASGTGLIFMSGTGRTRKTEDNQWRGHLGVKNVKHA